MQLIFVTKPTTNIVVVFLVIIIFIASHENIIVAFTNQYFVFYLVLFNKKSYT